MPPTQSQLRGLRRAARRVVKTRILYRFGAVDKLEFQRAVYRLRRLYQLLLKPDKPVVRLIAALDLVTVSIDVGTKFDECCARWKQAHEELLGEIDGQAKTELDSVPAQNS